MRNKVKTCVQSMALSWTASHPSEEARTADKVLLRVAFESGEMLMDNIIVQLK